MPRRAGVPATHLLGVSAIFVDLFGLAILVPLLPFRHTALVVATTLTAQYGAVLVGQLGWGCNVADAVEVGIVDEDHVVGLQPVCHDFFFCLGPHRHPPLTLRPQPHLFKIFIS